jgi:hypothetical protein
MKRLAPALRALAMLALIASSSAAEPRQPGKSYFGTNRYVEYIAGDLPIVLTSPHGGRLRPDALPDRNEGVVDMDLNTQELARAIAGELFARTGHHAHLIANQLHRRKLDPNREIKEAAQGNPGAELAWREFHADIEEALAAAVAAHGFAFLIDVHGHAHPIARIELGYGLGAAQLNQSDAKFDQSDFAAISTLADLHARFGGSGATLIRGPRSLGDFFSDRGIRAVPSPKDPQPGKNPFFAGGYIVVHHAGGVKTPKVDGVQIETYRVGIRDTAENRQRFAKIAVDVLTLFLHERYQFELSAPAKPVVPR